MITFPTFKNKDDFFYQSGVYRNSFISVVNHNPQIQYTDEVLHPCIRLWAESIVKHNLTIQSIETDLLLLIDEYNSDLVQKTFLPVVHKPKELRVQADFDVLQTFRQIQKSIHFSYVYPNIKKNVDIYQKIKDEYITYANQKYIPWTEIVCRK